ncbi:hypothetical protein BMS3Abin05_01614 [bacterium BMS3Abin05]|nr:hypothetical protein BMS3Abin05_01614 [bacterium BMS3Abin05]
MGLLFNNLDLEEILNYLKRLENRIAVIEERLGIKPEIVPEPEKDELKIARAKIEQEEKLEFQIGQFLFAKAGIIVLSIGIAIFLSFPYNTLPAYVPSLFGYVIVSILFLLSYLWRKLFSLISSYLLGAGLTLLYFATLRFYFFTPKQIVSGLALELLLLIIVTGITFFISVKRKSRYIALLGAAFGYAAAIASGEAAVIFPMIAAVSAAVVFLKLRYEWDNLLIFGILIAYLAHFEWFINNPILGNSIRLQTSPPSNLIFILLYVVIFAFGTLLRKENSKEAFHAALGSALNAAGAYGLLFLISMTAMRKYVGTANFAISILFLTLAIVFWVREKSKYSTFFYSIFGYLALSAAIVAQFGGSEYFLFLCWQSLLVLVTAIWFRSKYIVVANFGIYLSIFIAFLIVKGTSGGIGLSFGIVALLSARILNWKKSRLDLQTEYMRNAYLITALFVIPYALYHAMPHDLISLSWVGAALVYYTLSLLLKNKKYRWMALSTLTLTIVYVFVIGITSPDIIYKIVSFVGLGIALLTVSVFYTRKKVKTGLE